ncbi:MAG: protein translocase subunit SecF [Acutalibacteraceae bacterium]
MKKVIDFISVRKIFFAISLSIILIGVICNFIFGTTLDIQFSGGAMIKFSYTGEVNTEELKSFIQGETADTVTFSSSQDIMNSKDGKNAYTLSVQFSGTDAIDKELQKNLLEKVTEKYPDNEFAVMESSSVESQMGFMFLMKCLTAVAIASALMVLYVTIRFKRIGGLSAGMFALVALFHDVAIIYFLYVIFRMPIDGNFIAVVLMILGYSLNDTIVVYDRVREERKKLGAKTSVAHVFNVSASRVMKRTIFTSITTLAAIGTVYVVATIFNIETVKSFALPMMAGVISGCYSSLCIAGPLWVMWKERKEKSAK